MFRRRRFNSSGAAPAKPKDDGLPVYDRADALSRIADDEELLATLIDMFVADAPTYLTDIESALRAADWNHLTRAAHTIKGVLATFSARRGEASARDLEQAAKAGDAVACAGHAASLRTEVDLFIKTLALNS